jgi:hypothetical protein
MSQTGTSEDRASRFYGSPAKISVKLGAVRDEEGERGSDAAPPQPLDMWSSLCAVRPGQPQFGAAAIVFA